MLFCKLSFTPHFIFLSPHSSPPPPPPSSPSSPDPHSPPHFIFPPHSSPTLPSSLYLPTSLPPPPQPSLSPRTLTLTLPDGYGVQLDHRRLRTPLRNLLIVPSRPLALAIAQEWSGQERLIQPPLMHLVREGGREGGRSGPHLHHVVRWCQLLCSPNCWSWSMHCVSLYSGSLPLPPLPPSSSFPPPSSLPPSSSRLLCATQCWIILTRTQGLPW